MFLRIPPLELLGQPACQLDLAVRAGDFHSFHYLSLLVRSITYRY